MDEEWKIVNHSCSDDSNYEENDSDENKETVPLLDLEKGNSKEIPYFIPSRKRSRHINYVITGCRPIENRKRLKVDDYNYVNINISSNRTRIRYHTLRTLRRRVFTWLISILIFILLLFTILGGYVVIHSDRKYQYYKHTTFVNSTLSYDD